MRSKVPTIVPLATALAALAVDHAQATPATPEPAPGSVQPSEATQNLVPANLFYTVGEELFGMTAMQGSDGVPYAEHQSHASHASHRSHVSGG